MGITLFIVGFVITLTALSGVTLRGAHGASQGGDSGTSGHNGTNLLVLVGLIMSLAGIGLSTVGPAISFIKARSNKK